MQNKYLRMLGWAGAIFFFLFGSLVLVSAIAAGQSFPDFGMLVAIMYAASYFSWKYIARKPKTSDKPAV